MTIDPAKPELSPGPLEYRPRDATNDWARPAPRFGVASLLCLVATATLYVSVIGIGRLIWETYPDQRTDERIWGRFGISVIGLQFHIVGAVLGLVALWRNERRRSAAIGGFTMNVIAIGFWLVIHWPRLR